MSVSHLTVATVVINLGPAGTWESVCLGLAEGSLLPAPTPHPINRWETGTALTTLTCHENLSSTSEGTSAILGSLQRPAQPELSPPCSPT